MSHLSCCRDGTDCISACTGAGRAMAFAVRPTAGGSKRRKSAAHAIDDLLFGQLAGSDPPSSSAAASTSGRLAGEELDVVGQVVGFVEVAADHDDGPGQRSLRHRRHHGRKAAALFPQAVGGRGRPISLSRRASSFSGRSNEPPDCVREGNGRHRFSHVSADCRRWLY